MLIRLTQIDYEREMAFIAVDAASSGLAGIARLSADPDHEAAEFALLVRSDLQGRGLGKALFGHLRTYAAADGLQSLHGIVLNENDRMLELCGRLGLTSSTHIDQPGFTRVDLRLDRDPVLG